MTTTLPIANGAYTLETFNNARNQPCLKITTQRGKVIANYYYTSEEQRDKRAISICEGLEKRENEKAERHAGAKGKKLEAVSGISVGTIFYTCWGWEQTNVDFYQVVKVSGLRVYVRQIKQQTTETGFMSGHTTPIADEFKNDEILIVGVTSYGSFKIDGHYANIHETGREHRCSWYG